MPKQLLIRPEPKFPKPVPIAVPRISPPFRFRLNNFPPTSGSDILGEALSPKFTS